MIRFGYWFTSVILAASCSIAWSNDASWPNKALRIVVPGGSGGVTDIRARWLAARLSPALKQNVVVELKAGAGGNLGMEYGARVAPDGYTLTIIHAGTMTINPHLYSQPGYAPLTDFTPITQLGVGPLLLAVHPDVPATSLVELIQLAKSKPGALKFASPGIGTPPHMAGELFKRAAGVDVVHVPYKGGGQAVADLVGGHVNFSIEGSNVQLPHVKAGRLRAIAVTSAKRLDLIPEVPTMAEAGLPGYEFKSWVGIAVPAATPKPIVDRLYREISAILATAEAREWFGAAGTEPIADSPQEFAASIAAEHARWGKVIREAGIRID